MNTLLGYYRRSVSENVPPFNRSSSKIEALVQIAEMKSPEDRFDFTGTIESIGRRRAQQDQKRRETEEKLSIITPAPPPQAEI